jgi:iron complex transport system ATP-binding protein
MSILVEASGLSLPSRLPPNSFSLSGGELTCLIGPNGSGKTSLLHAMAGIGNPKGEIRIGGVAPRGLAPKDRMRLLSFLPTSREAHWPLSAHDLVALGCSSNEDRLRIPDMLEELQLSGLAGRRIDRLSTGERSRVLIARALASQARLLLLDEPTANLDPLWQLRLMDYLRRTARSNGQALLVAVHDLELARDFADRVMLMNKGTIVADGSPAAILDGADVPQVFGIERREGRWRPAS